MWKQKTKTNGQVRPASLPSAEMSALIEAGLRDLAEGKVPNLPNVRERNEERARVMVQGLADVACSKCGGSGYVGDTPIRGQLGLLAWKTAGIPSSQIPWCGCQIAQVRRVEYEDHLRTRSVRKASTMFEAAGIPPRFQGLTFETIPSTAGKERAIAAARMHLDLGHVDPQRIGDYDPNLAPNGNRRVKCGLLLIGPPGMGKTGILSVAFQGLVRQGWEGLWIELYQLFHEIQSGYGKAGDSSADQKLRYAGQVPLLFLDDCGDPDRDRQETDDKRQILWQIIDVRHGHDRPTLITSNLNRAEFERQWGERLAARVWEMAWVLPVGGLDLRA